MASMACASYFIMTQLVCVRFSVFPLSNISVFPSYTSWVASKKSASLSKPKMTQVMKRMPVLKKGNQLPLLMSEKEREENLPEKRKRFFSPALMSEKDAPHSTPGSLDPLLCSTPEMSAWIWFRQMFKKKLFQYNRI